jgi:general secretion pathway protein N
MSRRRTASVWIGGIAAIVLVGAARAEEPAGGDGDPAARREPDRAVSMRADLPSLAALTATRDRPLFIPGRRPPPDAPVAVPADAAPADEPAAEPEVVPVLVGVVAGPGLAVALLREAGGTEVKRIHVEEVFGGWRLVEISERSAVVQRGETRRVLSLKRPGEPAPGEAAADAEGSGGEGAAGEGTSDGEGTGDGAAPEADGGARP